MNDRIIKIKRTVIDQMKINYIDLPCEIKSKSIFINVCGSFKKFDYKNNDYAVKAGLMISESLIINVHKIGTTIINLDNVQLFDLPYGKDDIGLYICFVGGWKTIKLKDNQEAKEQSTMLMSAMKDLKVTIQKESQLDFNL